MPAAPILWAQVSASPIEVSVGVGVLVGLDVSVTRAVGVVVERTILNTFNVSPRQFYWIAHIISRRYVKFKISNSDRFYRLRVKHTRQCCDHLCPIADDSIITLLENARVRIVVDLSFPSKCTARSESIASASISASFACGGPIVMTIASPPNCFRNSTA